ncbi:MAG: hypothetical protein M3384_05320 [Acidobacteriota bacterium]|nr:hypothetical protein [Acidobacteriota bacterium]
MQLFVHGKVKPIVMSETGACCLGIVVITAIVAVIFPFLYRAEKRKGNLRLGDIIKNVLKKLT